jgi:hypothetical protein
MIVIGYKKDRAVPMFYEDYFYEDYQRYPLLGKIVVQRRKIVEWGSGQGGPCAAPSDSAPVSYARYHHASVAYRQCPCEAKHIEITLNYAI